MTSGMRKRKERELKLGQKEKERGGEGWEECVDQEEEGGERGGKGYGGWPASSSQHSKTKGDRVPGARKI